MKNAPRITALLFALCFVAACSNSVLEYADESGENTAKIVPPCKTDTEDNCEYGSLIDERDGQVYKAVKIGSQWWMAENLAYWFGTQYKTCCVGGEDCYKPGSRYDNSAISTHTICPSGWHLPSVQEYETLFATVGGDSIAGLVLRDRKTNWYDSLVGTDAYGFRAVHAVPDKSGEVNELQCFMTSTADTIDGEWRYYVCLNDTTAEIHRYFPDDDFAGRYNYPVRCAKDDTAAPPYDVSRIYETADVSRVAYGSCVDREIPEICKQDGEDNCEYGTLTDKRDGKVYKTVKIGFNWWMAENLNYAYLQPTGGLDSSSFCYKDSAEYCEKYGRLYLWSAAMDSVCPEGWHIPSLEEADNHLVYQYWHAYEFYDVEDPYGLDVISTGLWLNNRWASLSAEDSIPIGMFWTSVEKFGQPWAVMNKQSSGILLRMQYLNEYDAVSVRCIKDWTINPLP